MIDLIKQDLFVLYNPEEKKGCFLSGFDENKKLIVSWGIVDTDRPLSESVVTIYDQKIQPVLDQIRYVCVDIVVEIIAFPSAEDIFQLDPKEYGFIIEDLEDDKTGVILPNLVGVTDTKQVLYDLKKKYGIHGKVAISGFKTERMIVAK